MNKIHKQLTDKVPWYKAWHCNRHSSYLHWFVFLLAAELVFFAFNNMAISLRQEVSTGPQILVRTRSVFAESPPSNPDESGTLTIAIKDFPALTDAARGRFIPAKIYYPTSSGARYPLIILSHGAGGNRNGYAYIGEHLANHGYIVAAPNHTGSDSARIAQLMASGMTNAAAVESVALDQSEWQARAQDVTFLINQASVWDISDPDLMGRFDLARVGVIGHSYGAKTALSAAGALQNFSSGMTNLGDPRVDAIVPLSPPCMDPSTGVEDLGEFTNVSFSNVTVPAFGMSGTKDICFYSGLPKWRKGSYDLMPFGEKYFVVLENANHLDFTTADLPDGTQAETNRITRAMALVFFNVILKNDTASRTAYLNEAYMDSLTGAAIPDVQWFHTLANTYYVAPTGSDTNPGTETAPWKTFKNSVPKLKAGDTLYVRGGLYKESGINVGIQGTADQPIAIRNYPGEAPIVGPSYDAFSVAGNNAWELYDVTKHIYRSGIISPVVNEGANLAGKIDVNGKLYSLNIYPNYELLSSDVEYVTTQGIAYVGPGMWWNNTEARIYIRLKPPSEEAVFKKYTVPSDLDPRNNKLYISSAKSNVFGFASTAQHIIVDGISIAYGATAVSISSGASNLTFKNMEITPGFSAFSLGGAHDILIDHVTVNLGYPEWVARKDVKTGNPTPAHRLKLGGIVTQEDVYNLEVRNSYFNDAFDGITGVHVLHDVRIHHNEFTTIDDALQLGSSSYNVEFSYNKVVGVGPSKHGTGSSLYPGTTYIHHNVFDARRQILYSRYDPDNLVEPKERGWNYQPPHSRHLGSGFGNGDPWKIYNNTYLYYKNAGPGGVGGSMEYELDARNAGVPHEVYNNIFIQHSDDMVTWRGRVDDGQEIWDGNLFFRPIANPTFLGFFYQRWDSAATNKDFSSLAAFKNSSQFTITKNYYPPGWEANGIEVDPLLDEQFRPQNQEAWQGGVDLSQTGWPGTAEMITPYRGAVALNNQPPTVSVSANPTTGIGPLTVNFTATASDPDGTIASYAWDFGDSGTASVANPSHTYNTAGAYIAKVTVSDNAGATASAQIGITVKENQPPTVTVSATPTSGVAPLTVNFTATASDPDGTIASYVWNFGDSSITNTQNPAHTYNAAGTYTATVEVTDNGGATAQASVPIVVNPPLDTTPPTVNLSTPLNGATVAAKSSVTLSASASDNVGVAQVQFFINGVLLSTDLASPYSASWKVPASKGKTYQIQAIATDKTGNVGRSAIIQVTAR